MDMNSPHTVDRYVPRMRNAHLTTKDCQDYLYCGLPYLVPVLNMIWKTHFVPGPEPEIPNPVSMKVVSKMMIPHGKRIRVRVEGKKLSFLIVVNYLTPDIEMELELEIGI